MSMHFVRELALWHNGGSTALKAIGLSHQSGVFDVFFSRHICGICGICARIFLYYGDPSGDPFGDPLRQGLTIGNALYIGLCDAFGDP